MEKNRSTSFGGYLKTVRLEKGINLSAISKQTRISKDTLAALEDEDHARLPAEVFVKGFIRAYARAVGVDGDVAVNGFIESRRLLGESSQLKADETGTRSKTGARLLIILGILLALASVVVFMMRTTQTVKVEEPAATPQPPETAVVKKAPAVVKDPVPVVKEPLPPVPPGVPPEPVLPVKPGKTPTPGESAAGGLQTPKETVSPEEVAARTRQHVHIQALEETWLKVIVDSLTTNEYSLAPGDILELAADKGFNLLIGNATGIQLTFNDTPVPIPGKSGQVVTIQLP
ncbi:MAG: helix-turn-helix domain-containing protein [Desulfobacterales bacterium]|nr:helix-turn-helix domain-containing protein [Desulfobacterales bacterium]